MKAMHCSYCGVLQHAADARCEKDTQYNQRIDRKNPKN